MATDEKRVAAWTEEQFQIASQVVIPDSKSQASPINGGSNERYRVVHYPLSINKYSDGDQPRQLLIGGVDVSFIDGTNDAIAVYVILKYDNKNVAAVDAVDENDDSYNATTPEVVYRSHKWYTLSMPYIPSFLAFREIEPLMELISAQIESKPELKPDVILVDGNGQWHERRAGIATFVGVKTGIPAVGVGKTFYSIDGLMSKEQVLCELKMAVNLWYDEMAVISEQHHATTTTTSSRGLILSTTAIPSSSKEGSNPLNNLLSKKELKEIPTDETLRALHRVANGIAIPMKGGTKNNNEVLAYALIGHGGNVRANKSGASKDGGKGSKVPIYISVGDGIVLEDAVALCSYTSIARIPEPVREADLYGRQIVREKLAEISDDTDD